jgi:murein DD-endopeptidase MepM/ murein hydrolase activator NlpD
VLALIIIAPFTVKANFFDFLTQEIEVVATSPASEAASDIELLSAEQNPNPSGSRGGAELVVDENALISSGPVGADEIASENNNGEIRVYTVREGDSLSEVAEMFGVTANTIRWANDISRNTDIQPGQTLVILPIAGVRHIIKSGDTIGSIAKKYEGNEEEILSFNQLASASDIVVGETLIIPGGELHATQVPVTESKSGKGKSGGSSSAGFTHPAPGSVKTQGIHGYNGVDLAGSTGSTIRAAAAGEVIVAKGGGGWNGGYGNYIVIKHKNGTQTLYAHLSSLSVGVGSYVEQGQTIGGMGNTGRSTGTHLHFEVRGGKNPF